MTNVKITDVMTMVASQMTFKNLLYGFSSVVIVIFGLMMYLSFLDTGVTLYTKATNKLVFHKIDPYKQIVRRKIIIPKEEPKPIAVVEPVKEDPIKETMEKGTTSDSVIYGGNVEVFYKAIDEILKEKPQGFK